MVSNSMTNDNIPTRIICGLNKILKKCIGIKPFAGLLPLTGIVLKNITFFLDEKGCRI